MRVCMSGGGCGQGAIAREISATLQAMPGFTFVGDAADLEQTTAVDITADVAVCTTGRMLIRDPALVDPAEVDDLYRGNYLLPRCFTERHIAAMRRDHQPGLIIHLGSNAAWYGNVGAEDYGAFKSALRKYLELRARNVRTDGIRISCLGFGGVAGPFWDKALSGADPAWAASIVPGTRAPLTLADAAAVVVAIMKLPPRVTIRDALIVAVDYQ